MQRGGWGGANCARRPPRAGPADTSRHPKIESGFSQESSRASRHPQTACRVNPQVRTLVRTEARRILEHHQSLSRWMQQLRAMRAWGAPSAVPATKEIPGAGYQILLFNNGSQ